MTITKSSEIEPWITEYFSKYIICRLLIKTILKTFYREVLQSKTLQKQEQVTCTQVIGAFQRVGEL